jgi:hypothetical protein
LADQGDFGRWSRQVVENTPTLCCGAAVLTRRGFFASDFVRVILCDGPVGACVLTDGEMAFSGILGGRHDPARQGGDPMRRFGLFLMGLLAGGAVGVVLALLLTPASGDKLRKEAQTYYEQLLEEARQAAEGRRKELEMELKDATGTAPAGTGTAPAES